jgi:hypothetical protein
VSRSADPVVACSLGQSDLAERQARWRRLADASLVERTRTDTGLRLVFRRDDGVETELGELAELERECCAFADWTVTADGGRVVLDVSASSAEAVAAVQAMFATLG